MEQGESADALAQEPTVHETLVSLQSALQRVVASPAVQAAAFPPFGRSSLPKTLNDCFTLAQNAATEKETKKKKQDKAAETAAPVGGDYLTGAFPNVKEAPFMAWCEEFFRPLRKEDIEQAFGTHLTDPASDPAFKMPALGKHYTDVWAADDAAAAEEPQRELPETRHSTRTRVPSSAKGGNRAGSHSQKPQKQAASSQKAQQSVRAPIRTWGLHSSPHLCQPALGGFFSGFRLLTCFHLYRLPSAAGGARIRGDIASGGG